MNITTDLYTTGPPHPKILYKYTRWDKSGEQSGSRHKLLTAPQLYFASLKSFNDPFDCQLPRGWASKTNEEILSYLERRHGDDREGLSKIKKRLETNRNEYLNSLNEADIKMTDSQTGVFCLSPNPTNSLLWAHYATGHRGYCIGYDTNKTVEFMKSYCDEPNLTFGLINVEYRVELPKLDPFLEDDKEWFFQRYRYKANEWSYEEEYRIILMKHEDLQNNDREVNLAVECLAEIVLGSRIGEETETEIRKKVESLRSANPELKLLRANMAEKNFGYELIPID